MIKHYNGEDFNKEIENGLVLIDFYANWCGPCKMLIPELEKLVKEKEITVLEVNVDDYEDLAREYKVMSIPNLYLMKDGKEVKHTLGFMPYDELLEFVKED